MSEFTTEPAYTSIKMPEQSEWQCYLLPHWVLHPQKGDEPNWFWRKMQYLAFGFRWVKRSPNG